MAAWQATRETTLASFRSPFSPHIIHPIVVPALWRYLGMLCLDLFRGRDAVFPCACLQERHGKLIHPLAPACPSNKGTLQKENDIDTPRARPRPSTHVLNHTPIPNIPQPTGGSHGEPIPWRALPTRRGRDTKHVARRDVHRGRWAPQPRQRAWACHICPTTTLGLALSILC